MHRKLLLSILLSVVTFSVWAQTNEAKDSSAVSEKIVRVGNEMHYNVGNGKTLVYAVPRKFDFVLSLPRDAKGIVTTPFKKESVKPLVAIAGSTVLLLFADQAI